MVTKQKPTKKLEYDIMISYQHEDKDMCEQIYSRLTKQNKFRVWFDQENMYGSIMTRMAEGIEKSEFVLICMSSIFMQRCY